MFGPPSRASFIRDAYEAPPNWAFCLALRHTLSPPVTGLLFRRRLWGFGGSVRLGGGGVRGAGVLAGLFEQALLLPLLLLGEFSLSLLKAEVWSGQLDRLSPCPGIPAGAFCLRLISLAKVTTDHHGRLGCRRPAAPREAWLR